MVWLTDAFGLASGSRMAGCATSGAATSSASAFISARLDMWNPPGSCTLNRQSSSGGRVNRSIESVLRFVNLTASGLLAGSLGFGEKALVPGWRQELPSHRDRLGPIEAL